MTHPINYALSDESLTRTATLMALLGPAWEAALVNTGGPDGPQEQYVQIPNMQPVPGHFTRFVDAAVNHRSEEIAAKVTTAVDTWLEEADDETFLNIFAAMANTVTKRLEASQWSQRETKIDAQLTKTLAAVTERVVTQTITERLASKDLDMHIAAKIQGIDPSAAEIRVELPGVAVVPA